MVSSVVLCFRFRQPLLEFFKRDDVTVALLFLFSGPLAPGIESIIGNVRGGTGIDAWASTATATNYYSEAVRRTKQACRYGKLKGIMWHQGETDAGPVASTTYMARLSNLIAAFRSELGDVPVVVGEIPDAIAESQYFNPVITTVSQHISDSACALSDGCTTISDNIHFDRDSQIVMGERFAEAMLTLQSAQ